MTDDPIAALEFEGMLFRRHLVDVPGRSRRTGSILEQSAYLLLSLLDAGGPATISDLSSITGLDASTLNRQTAALLRDGHAERIPDPDGGIARRFRPTTAGRAALEEERKASRAALSKIVDDWDDNDRATLAILLGRLNHAIEARSGRSWPRPEIRAR
jgi:DNA-binding MarR family transcriptional regulator